MAAFAPAALCAFRAGTPAAFLAVVTFAVATVVAVIALTVATFDTLRTLTIASPCTLWADTATALDTVRSPAVFAFDATKAKTTLRTSKYCAARNYWVYAAIVVVIVAPRGGRAGRRAGPNHYWRASTCVLVIMTTAHTKVWLRTARDFGDHS